ncbi:hypothetical protein [Burkholderia anthina]|uniref:hypothetical protein n=1 Tax=Burkholderia anthina TaxID=179879 RepID=UPI0037BE6872
MTLITFRHAVPVLIDLTRPLDLSVARSLALLGVAVLCVESGDLATSCLYWGGDDVPFRNADALKASKFVFYVAEFID